MKKHIPLDLVLPHFTSTGINIEFALKHYSSFQRVGQFALKTRNGCTDFPVDVFYDPNPNTELGHSNYAAIYVYDGKAMITNAKCVEQQLYTGSYTDDGSVIYPRFQHDFRYFNNGRNFCDGGWWMKSTLPGHEARESMMTRWGGPLSNKLITIQVIDGKLYNITEEHAPNDPPTT